MSFFKFFGRKKSKEEVVEIGIKDPEMEQEQERRKLRHSLSVSRSGRFKQKNKERQGILDRPELFNASEQEASSPSRSPGHHRRRDIGRTDSVESSESGRNVSQQQAGSSRKASQQGSGSRQAAANSGPPPPSSSSSSSSSAAGNSQSSQGQGRSPNNSCRELNGRIIPGSLRMGQQGVAS